MHPWMTRTVGASAPTQSGASRLLKEDAECQRQEWVNHEHSESLMTQTHPYPFPNVSLTYQVVSQSTHSPGL